MPECENNCALAARVERLEDDLKTEKDRRQKTHKEFYDRIQALENRQSVNQEKLETIESKIDSMDGKLDALLQKPGKRWEAVVAAAISAVVAGLAAYLLARVGLG